MSHESDTKKDQDENWQRRLLPLMSRMIIVLSAFFLIASLAQVIYLEKTISKIPKFDSKEAFSYIQNRPASNDTLIELTRLKALVMLEGNMSDNLYLQSHVFLMERIWTSYIGFLTGMILALVGGAFVLGKLRTPQSELGAKTSKLEFFFKSTSPGLIMAVLGSALMLATILTHHEIKTNHQAIYLHDSYNHVTDTSLLKTDTFSIPTLPPPKTSNHK